MKNVINWLMVYCWVAPLFAQNTMPSANDFDRISLNVFIPEQVENIPPAARSTLTNKLTQAVTKKGLAGAGASPRFLLTANMDVLAEDIVAGAPARQTYQFEVSLFIVDFIDKITVSSTSFEVKGAGSNQTKAYTNAIRSIDFKHPKVDAFLEEGKIKIIEYYNSRCDFIIARAKAQASQRLYADAMTTLAGIPEVSKDCYLKAMDEIGPIYKEFADYNCKILVSAASSCWASRPNTEGAQLAGALLTQIDPGSVCYDDAQKLISRMEEKVLKDEKRDWKFIEKVFENQVMLESLRIRAWRDVGVAWGKGQQPTYNDIIWIFR